MKLDTEIGAFAASSASSIVPSDVSIVTATSFWAAAAAAAPAVSLLSAHPLDNASVSPSATNMFLVVLMVKIIS